MIPEATKMTNEEIMRNIAIDYLIEQKPLGDVKRIPNSKHLPRKNAKDGEIYYVEKEDACYIFAHNKWYKCLELKKLYVELLYIDDTHLTFKKVNKLLKPYGMYMEITIDIKPRITYYEVRTYKKETAALISEVRTSNENYLKYACQKLGMELMDEVKYGEYLKVEQW